MIKLKFQMFWLRITKFLQAFLLFFRMYADGFYFSKNTNTSSDGSRWGFYRFNHKMECALFDIDFNFAKDSNSYFHVHGDDVRVELSYKLIRKTNSHA
jgi:hypothetical protein